MKGILGANKKRRLSGMCANLAQLVFGAAFVTHFFKDAPGWIRIIAISMFVILAMLAVFAEPEEEIK